MQLHVRFRYAAISLLCIEFFTLSSTHAVCAPENIGSNENIGSQGNIEEQLKKLETKVFRKTFESDHLDSRIKRLEITFFPGHSAPEFMKPADRVEKLLFKVFQNQEIPSETLRRIDSDVVLILLDCSYSMRYDLSDSTIAPDRLAIRPEPTTRMLAAKNALKGLVLGIKPVVYLGFRIYGNVLSGDQFSDCKQTKTLAAPGLDNRINIFHQTRTLFAQGASPLKLAIDETINKDLVRFTGKKSVVLLTDGTDSCGQDPVKAARELGKKTPFFVFDFGREDSDARTALQAIAEATGGSYSKIDKIEDVYRCVQNVVRRIDIDKPAETTSP